MNNDELRKKWLRQTTDCVSLVLNDNELHLFKSANNIVNKFMTDIDYAPIFIAVCLHDKDVDEIEKRLETPHYQCLVWFKHKMSFNSIIQFITSLFPFINENQIGIEKVNDIGAMTRYVVHRGFYGKHEYQLSEVFTNDMSIFMKYYNMVTIKDVLDCVAIVEAYNYNLKDIISNVSNYMHWRSIIKDLICDNRLRGRL